MTEAQIMGSTSGGLKIPADGSPVHQCEPAPVQLGELFQRDLVRTDPPPEMKAVARDGLGMRETWLAHGRVRLPSEPFFVSFVQGVATPQASNVRAWSAHMFARLVNEPESVRLLSCDQRHDGSDS